jgi:hypothetical protein
MEQTTLIKWAITAYILSLIGIILYFPITLGNVLPDIAKCVLGKGCGTMCILGECSSGWSLRIDQILIPAYLSVLLIPLAFIYPLYQYKKNKINKLNLIFSGIILLFPLFCLLITNPQVFMIIYLLWVNQYGWATWLITLSGIFFIIMGCLSKDTKTQIKSRLKWMLIIFGVLIILAIIYWFTISRPMAQIIIK